MIASEVGVVKQRKKLTRRVRKGLSISPARGSPDHDPINGMYRVHAVCHGMPGRGRAVSFDSAQDGMGGGSGSRHVVSGHVRLCLFGGSLDDGFAGQHIFRARSARKRIRASLKMRLLSLLEAPRLRHSIRLA